MTEAEFIDILKSSVNELLRWVGFGTLTGLAAKAILPGRDPGGAVSTMLTGIAGSVIGCGTTLFFCATQPSTQSASAAFSPPCLVLSSSCFSTACSPVPFSKKPTTAKIDGCIAFAGESNGDILRMMP